MCQQCMCAHSYANTCEGSRFALCKPFSCSTISAVRTTSAPYSALPMRRESRTYSFRAIRLRHSIAGGGYTRRSRRRRLARSARYRGSMKNRPRHFSCDSKERVGGLLASNKTRVRWITAHSVCVAKRFSSSATKCAVFRRACGISAILLSRYPCAAHWFDKLTIRVTAGAGKNRSTCPSRRGSFCFPLQNKNCAGGQPHQRSLS